MPIDSPVYRRHRCKKHHRLYRSFMKCAIPRAVWISGEGPFALIAWCEVPTVSLHETIELAERAKERIDCSACGHICHGKHVIVRIQLDPRF